MVGIHMFILFYLYFGVFFNFLCHATYRDSNSPDYYYEKHSLAEEEICHPLRIKLKPMPISRAIMIRPNQVFDRWTYRTTDLYCKFKIKTGRSIHLMAVIQSLSFRQVDGDCIDYVKFKRKYHNETKKFCGQFSRKKKGGVEKYLTELNQIDNAFERSDSEGEIETTIFVSKQPLEQGDPPLDIQILYTPYLDCTHGYHERIGDINRSSRQWNYCIADEYICDGYQNCIPDICKDEINCPNDLRYEGLGTGAKVTVAAVTTIVLCFIIFLMSIWICRRHKKLCWSPDCAGPGPQESRFSRANRESGVVSDQPVSSAPMLQVSVVSSALDKDLPPSYDSLFPEHANPSTT